MASQCKNDSFGEIHSDDRCEWKGWNGDGGKRRVKITGLKIDKINAKNKPAERLTTTAVEKSRNEFKWKNKKAPLFCCGQGAPWALAAAQPAPWFP